MAKTLLATIDELTTIYKRYGKDLDVVMAKDEEGNGFSPLEALSPVVYEAANGWSGEVTEEDDPEIGEPLENPNAVCLWPTN